MHDKSMIMKREINHILAGLLFAGLLIVSCTGVEAPAPCGPLPNDNQLALQDMEMYAFLHYSLNTYTDQEWGYGNEDPSVFNPSMLDVRQWVKVCKDSGMKGIILTAKHHCGFCLWPSEYTEYSVKNSPWKDGKGDIVGELAEACSEMGLKFAVYLSPWDRNHPEYGRDEYITYFRNQLRELLTNYGDIYEVWFDGANGGNGWYGGADETRTIDRTTYYQWPETYRMIRELQPGICIWNDGSDRGDLRWVGTEAGNIGQTNWSLLYHDGEVPYHMLHYGVEDGDSFVPGETNTSIRPGWFYHDYENDHVKSLSKLMETYYKSVGRNSTLLLNFPIDRDGLIHPVDSARGAAFKKMIDEVFATDLARGAKVTAGNIRGGSRKFAATKVLDGKPDTYWATDDDVVSSTLEFEFSKPVTFNRFLASEYIKLGQRVRKFSLEALVDGEWIALKDIYAEPGTDGMTTIGRKRIICFPAVTASALRFNIDDSKACPLISRVALYLAPELTPDIPDSGELKSSALNIIMAGSNDGPSRSIMIDLEGRKTVKGISYLPPRNWGDEGIITNYSFWAQVEGEWVKLSSGEFSNIINNPIWQTVNTEPVETSLIRLDAEILSSGQRVQFADLEVLFE